MTTFKSICRRTLILVSAPLIAGFIQRATCEQMKKQSPTNEQAQLREDLRQIGEKVAKAVLDKDIQTLLSFDRPDLRSADEVALKNTKSELYCFLFDSSCIKRGNEGWRSVYDKLSRAHPMGIQVKTATSPYDHRLYGSLLFYDRSSLSEKELRSHKLLCDEEPKSLATWNFRLEDGKWKPVTPLFGSETGGLCGE